MSLFSQDENVDVTAGWMQLVEPSIQKLHLLAGTTEDEFLTIGAKLQDFYARSSELHSLATALVDTVSGEAARQIIGRLGQIMEEMQAYLEKARQQSEQSCETLARTSDLLNQVSEPLEGFQKMYKVLRMLSTSTKIESARIGENGAGFLTLAMDVEKLSHQVNERSASILGHRQALVALIEENLRLVRSAEYSHDAEVHAVMKNTAASLEKLVKVNERCNQFGELVSSISQEVSANIGEVVSSLQAHDITRQQVEHIIEALERMQGHLRNPADRRGIIVEAGDVCELQAAQLRHAATELDTAVTTIISSLSDIARKQSAMVDETRSVAGGNDSGSSFVEEMKAGMAVVMGILARCAQADQDLSATMKKVAETIGEISAFVTDIEEIGTEIDLIALNSQIKAAHTGDEGAALGVLAEAIKRLSLDAVVQTEAVSKTLLQVNEITGSLFHDVEKDLESAAMIETMENEVSGVMNSLVTMNENLMTLVNSLGTNVLSLNYDIEQVTSGIDVHQKTGVIAHEVESSLEAIVTEARRLEPASEEFKDNLRHMEERYTMQSERHIHEAIARKRSGGSGMPAFTPVKSQTTSTSDSEFGDNVDLF